MLRLTLVTNAIHLEAARRARLWEERRGQVRSRWLDVLVHEPRRLRLTPGDRRLWPLRLPVHPLAMAALVAPGLLGLVGELRLAHLHGAGRALRLLARLARRHSLLDDGLDQYRERPRAVDPTAFPAGTPYWLFDDAAACRAAWCARFDCRDLGPLYAPATGPAMPEYGSMIVDAPGVERLRERSERLPRPWLVVPHPVAAKRRWTLPSGSGDALRPGDPEGAIATGIAPLVVVGESMTLLAAARIRPAGVRLLVALPPTADPNLLRLAEALARRDRGVELLPPEPEGADADLRGSPAAPP